MRSLVTGLILLGLAGAPGFCATPTNGFVGHWDFNLNTPQGTRAAWLGISDKNGQLDVWFQPTGGNVRQVHSDDVKVNGSHLTLMLSPASGNRPAMTWELDAANGKLTGTQTMGTRTTALNGMRAPELNHPFPKAWTDPKPLFNGKNLDGWEPIGDVANNHWKVENGELLNTAHGANLRTTSEFENFKVHFEVNCPEDANSGFYLRGRYEVQLEYEALEKNPPERRMGSIYGRIAPSVELPRKPGQWETFDVTLVGRTVTVVRDGTTIIDRKKIEGITGGALNANEGDPGPFYIQGDHTGGLKFRNITVQTPKR